MERIWYKTERIVVVFLFICILITGYTEEVTPQPYQFETKQTYGQKLPSSLVPKEQAQRQVNWMGHWLYEDLRETLVREVAKAFRFENFDIKLNLKFPQDIMGVRSKPLVAKYIADMIRSNNIEWDVIWLDDNIYSLVAEELNDPVWGKKYLVDFEKVPGFKDTQKKFIIDDPVYRNQTGGIIVGPYIEGYLYAIWYNKNVAKRLGLKVKERGMTFDDLLGYLHVVYDYNNKNDTPISAFYEAKDWLTLEMLFQSLVKSKIKNFDEAISEFSSPNKQAALFEGFKAFEKLGRYNPLIPSHNENIWFDTRHLVLENKALFYVGGTWMYSHWRGIDKKKLKNMVPAELPVFQEVDHSLGGYIPTWAVMKDSPNREAAISFLMWWIRPQIAEKWVRYTKNPTGLQGNLDSAILGSNLYEIYQADITQKYGSRLHYSADAVYLLGKNNGHLKFEINKKLRMLLTGQITAQQAYKDIVEKCNLGDNHATFLQ
ncbi:extracellular solute-binding protein [Thermodesulfobacteriota bacterium]